MGLKGGNVDAAQLCDLLLTVSSDPAFAELVVLPEEQLNGVGPRFE